MAKPETGKQYTRRILGNVGKGDPLKILEASPGKLDRLLKGLSNAKARKRPGKGKWSIAEIVAHLAEAELVIAYRMRLMAGSNGTRIQLMDQDAWVKGGNYNGRPLRMSLEHFRSQRKANLDFLRVIPRSRWNNFGRHPERGKETIKHTIALYAGHDLNHLKQIATMRKPRKSPQTKRR